MTVKAATQATQVSQTKATKGPDPLELKSPTTAEFKALDNLAAKNPKAFHKLDKNTEAVVINGKLFVGQWQTRDGERHLYWSRAPAKLPPTTADYNALNKLPASKTITLDKSTVAAVIGDKVMIGKWETHDGERHLYWSQAGRLEK